MGPLGDLGGLLVRFLSIFIDFGVDFGTLLGGFGTSWGSFLEALGSLGASWGLSWNFLGSLWAFWVDLSVFFSSFLGFPLFSSSFSKLSLTSTSLKNV